MVSSQNSDLGRSWEDPYKFHGPLALWVSSHTSYRVGKAGAGIAFITSLDGGVSVDTKASNINLIARVRGFVFNRPPRGAVWPSRLTTGRRLTH
jgi:hypothetical protein